MMGIPANQASIQAEDTNDVVHVRHLNKLLQDCGIAQEQELDSIQQSSSSLFVLLFEAIFARTVDEVDRNPDTFEKKRGNVTVVLRELEYILGRDLSYIDAGEVVRRNDVHLSHLIRVFLEIVTVEQAFLEVLEGGSENDGFESIDDWRRNVVHPASGTHTPRQGLHHQPQAGATALGGNNQQSSWTSERNRLLRRVAEVKNIVRQQQETLATGMAGVAPSASEHPSEEGEKPISAKPKKRRAVSRDEPLAAGEASVSRFLRPKIAWGPADHGQPGREARYSRSTAIMTARMAEKMTNILKSSAARILNEDEVQTARTVKEVLRRHRRVLAESKAIANQQNRQRMTEAGLHMEQLKNRCTNEYSMLRERQEDERRMLEREQREMTLVSKSLIRDDQRRALQSMENKLYSTLGRSMGKMIF